MAKHAPNIYAEVGDKTQQICRRLYCCSMRTHDSLVVILLAFGSDHTLLDAVANARHHFQRATRQAAGVPCKAQMTLFHAKQRGERSTPTPTVDYIRAAVEFVRHTYTQTTLFTLVSIFVYLCKRLKARPHFEHNRTHIPHLVVLKMVPKISMHTLCKHSEM